MFFKLIGEKIWHEFHELARTEWPANFRMEADDFSPLDSFAAKFLTGGNQRPCSSPFQSE
jgi:hypothetical protein